MTEAHAAKHAVIESQRHRARKAKLGVGGIIFGVAAAFWGVLAGVAGLFFVEGRLLEHRGLMLSTFLASVILGLIVWRLVWLTHRTTETDEFVPEEFYFRFKELRAQCEGLEEQASTLRQKVLNYHTWLHFQHGVEFDVVRFEQYVHTQLHRRKLDREGLLSLQAAIGDRFADILQTVVNTLGASRTALLNYRPENEVFFFDIFELRGDDRLHPIARAHSPEVTTHNRSWDIGEGEVGDCVYQQTTILRDKASVGGARRGPQWQQTDDLYFIRRISTPIFAADNRPHQAYGALCATSSDPDRFEQTDCMFIENLAQPLASLFQRRDWALRTISKRLQQRDSSLSSTETESEHSESVPHPGPLLS